MPKREISESKRAWLKAEIENWRSEGALADDQPDRILALYESQQESSQRKHSLAVFVLMSIAAFLVGLAALLLIGYNWDGMPKAEKLAIIFGVIAATHGVACWLRYRRGARRMSEAVFFLGCFFYGCGIWLVAQIFNIQGHYPNALWLWALGTIPFALCLDTLLLHAFAAALLATWVGTEILDSTFVSNLPGLPHACFTLPLLALPGLFWAYRKRAPVTVGLYVLLLAWWMALQPVAWHSKLGLAVFGIGAGGALFLAIAAIHRPNSPMAAPYRLYGVLLTAGVLSLLSFGDFIRIMLHEDDQLAATRFLAGCVLGATGLGAILLADHFARDRSETDPAVAYPSGFGGFLLGLAAWRQAVPTALMLLMAVLCVWVGVIGGENPQYTFRTSGLTNWTATVLIPTVAANVAMIAFAIWLIRSGLREDRGIVFAAGVTLFLFWAVLRYVDLFSGVGGMLGASIMFFACGTALFGVARYWSHRKEVRRA